MYHVYNAYYQILERTMGCPESFEHRRAELREVGVIRPDDTELQQGEKIAASYIGR
jgi:hypothetical protein